MKRTAETEGAERPEQEGDRWLVGFLAGAAALVGLRARADFLVDDAFISFRYARSWWESGVPVFNSFELADGGQPVEGFSNALWTGLLALVHGAGFDLVAATPWIQLVCALLVVLLVARAAAALDLGTAARIGAPVLTATAAPFVAWSQGGMETTLFTALLALLFIGVTAEPRREERLLLCAAVIGAVGTTWVRVEGFAWVMGTALAAAVAMRATGGAPRGAAPRLAAAVAMAAAALALQLLLRRAVFGEWLPNTVAAKTGVDQGVLTARGLRYVASWALVALTPLFATLALLPALKHPRVPARRTALAGAGVAIGFAVYCVAVGGDWMPFFRFLAPAAPVLALVVAIGADRMAAPLGPLLLISAAATQPLALLDVHVAPKAAREALRFRGFEGGYRTEAKRVEAARTNLEYVAPLGRALAAATEPGDVLAYGAIGAVGWYAPALDLLDRNGLVTPEVARAPASAGGTAGHDKRVPHSWFLDHGTPSARYLFATWVAAAPPAVTPEVRARLAEAVRRQRQVNGPEEAQLFERTAMRIVPFPAEGRTLILLEREP
ncbi:MAG: hypothetical protein VX460_15225 [Planctomycetota bacterium]|nr:hypothetical protein [Planctomycetota bacterium]